MSPNRCRLCLRSEHLSRASTSFYSAASQDVDGRDEPGHDAVFVANGPMLQAPMSKPGPITAKPLSVLLTAVFSAAYPKQGFAARELVTRWAEMPGPERSP